MNKILSSLQYNLGQNQLIILNQFQEQECSGMGSVESLHEDRLRIGSTLVLRITILEMTDIPPEYSDVFCQFR